MARPSIKFATVKNNKLREQLRQMWKTHPAHYTRVRAHAILLSSQGYEISAVAEIFGVDRDSVSSWIDRYELGGMDALQDADRPGAPATLDAEQKELLRKLFASYPNQPSKVLAELKQSEFNSYRLSGDFDAPLFEVGGFFEALKNRAKLHARKRYSPLIDSFDQFNNRPHASPSHRRCPLQRGLDR